METLSLFNSNNQEFIANVVRYFEINGNSYLIFHKNETDMQGYIVLYACKVVNNDNKFLTYAIDDEIEWSNVKSEIQRIVVNNRKGIQNDFDKDFNDLKGIVINDYKMFKLKTEISTELGNNKKSFDTMPVMPESVTTVMPESVTTVMPEPVAPVMPEPVAPVMPEPVAPVMPEPVASVMPESVAPVMPESVTTVMPEPVASVMPEQVKQVETEQASNNEELLELKEKYDKLLVNYETMKSENLNLVTDNARLHTLINQIKNIIA